MKDEAREIASNARGERETRNVLREYLQHVILRTLFERDLLDRLVFHGGTALRILHDLPRFSEDLDFHLIDPEDTIDLEELKNGFATRLFQQGYDAEMTIRTDRIVQQAFVKFGDLLYETGVSDHESEKLQINIEVDTNPPTGFQCETNQVNRFFPFVVHHHNRPSFLAGKLHALFQRNYTKGRDLFDLNFYLTRWNDVSPNFEYLNNALCQTGYTGEDITQENWRHRTAETVENVKWDEVMQDLEPFLLRREDLDAFRKDLLLKELR